MAATNSTIPALLTPIATKTVQVVSGNLFQVAAQYLGDATQWTRIASFNGLGPNPWFTGLLVLRIPPINTNGSNGGILYSSSSITTTTNRFTGATTVAPAPPAPPRPTPPPQWTWTLLQTVYPGQLFLNGKVVMALPGFFPTSPPILDGTPWTNGGVLELTSTVQSSTSPSWIVGLPTSSKSLASGGLFLNGLVVEVA